MRCSCGRPRVAGPTDVLVTGAATICLEPRRGEQPVGVASADDRRGSGIGGLTKWPVTCLPVCGTRLSAGLFPECRESAVLLGGLAVSCFFSHMPK